MTNNDYKELCLTALSKLIEEGTRFGVADVEFADFNSAAAYVWLWGAYAVKVKGPENETGGHARPSGRDIEVSSPEVFDEEHWNIINEYQATASRYEILRKVLNQQGWQGYLAYPHGTKLTIEQYSREVLFERTCGTCYGEGKNTCRGCSGHGRYSCNSCNGYGSIDCSWCHGSGSNTCNSCGGMGSTTQCETIVDHNGHSHTNWVTHHCTWCGGSGRNSCNSCGGSGSNYCSSCGGSGIYTCSNCGGGGKETCYNCSGYGSRVRTGRVETQLESSFRYTVDKDAPAWVKDELSRMAGHTSLAPLGTLETLKVEVVDGASEAKAEFRAKIPYAEVTVRIRTREYNVRMLGATPVLHYADTLFQDMLLPDLDSLEAAMGGWGLLNPLYHRRAERVIKSFLESEINQKMVPCLPSGYDSAIKKLSGVVNEDYVKKSDKALRTLLRRSAGWACLRWGALIAVLTPVSIFLVFWATESGKQYKMLATQESLLLLSTDNVWLIGLTATIFAWVISRLARWRTASWIKRVGNNLLDGLAQRESVHPGKWMALFNVTVALCTGFGVVSANPIWINQAGKLQGQYALSGFLPPEVAEPVVPKIIQKAKTKKHVVKKPKKHVVKKPKKQELLPEQSNADN